MEEAQGPQLDPLHLSKIVYYLDIQSHVNGNLGQYIGDRMGHVHACSQTNMCISKCSISGIHLDIGHFP